MADGEEYEVGHPVSRQQGSGFDQSQDQKTLRCIGGGSWQKLLQSAFVHWPHYPVVIPVRLVKDSKLPEKAGRCQVGSPRELVPIPLREDLHYYTLRHYGLDVGRTGFVRVGKSPRLVSLVRSAI